MLLINYKFNKGRYISMSKPTVESATGNTDVETFDFNSPDYLEPRFPGLVNKQGLNILRAISSIVLLIIWVFVFAWTHPITQFVYMTMWGNTASLITSFFSLYISIKGTENVGSKIKKWNYLLLEFVFSMEIVITVIYWTVLHDMIPQILRKKCIFRLQKLYSSANKNIIIKLHIFLYEKIIFVSNTNNIYFLLDLCKTTGVQTLKLHFGIRSFWQIFRIQRRHHSASCTVLMYLIRSVPNLPLFQFIFHSVFAHPQFFKLSWGIMAKLKAEGNEHGIPLQIGIHSVPLIAVCCNVVLSKVKFDPGSWKITFVATTIFMFVNYGGKEFTGKPLYPFLPWDGSFRTYFNAVFLVLISTVLNYLCSRFIDQKYLNIPAEEIFGANYIFCGANSWPTLRFQFVFVILQCLITY